MRMYKSAKPRWTYSTTSRFSGVVRRLATPTTLFLSQFFVWWIIGVTEVHRNAARAAFLQNQSLQRKKARARFAAATKKAQKNKANSFNKERVVFLKRVGDSFFLKGPMHIQQHLLHTNRVFFPNDVLSHGYFFLHFFPSALTPNKFWNVRFSGSEPRTAWSQVNSANHWTTTTPLIKKLFVSRNL